MEIEAFPDAKARIATDDETYGITASASLPERHLRVLKHGHTFGLFDPHGDITEGGGSPEGLYHDDTRFVSTLQLWIDGVRPLMLSSTVGDDNALLAVDLTNPDILSGDRVVLHKDLLHILRTRFIWDGRSFERLRLQNFDDRAHRFRLTFRYDCDFADLFEVRGHPRPRRGRVEARADDDRRVTFRYTALDGQQLATVLEFDPAPSALTRDGAHYDLTLGPRERGALFLTCTCETGEPRRAVVSFASCFRAARRARRASTGRAATVETSNEVLNEVLRRSSADLYMLLTNTERGPYPYAGVPWFCTAFGRDGIITAIQTLWFDPEIARGVLTFLAAEQATAADPEADAEPGKILHEMRLGEMARLKEIPFGRYYGSVDSTPLFVLLAGLYYERTRDLATIRQLWPHIEAALRWIDRYGDPDGDGLLEYARKEAAGLFNQGWKDSHDSIFHEGGELATLPIALCEVQGYAFAAKRHAAELARALDKEALSERLLAEAETLRRTIEERFWMEDLGFYALALDGAKRPCRVLASNAAHLLFCGVPSADRAARVAARLLSPDFFSGWGLRTVAGDQPRFNPISYHNGSVWPHDNALAALGLSRYGHADQVHQLFQGLFDAATYMELRRLPELFCGFRRQPGTGPTAYPVSCAPQAWASATMFGLLQATLGISFDSDRREILFRQPRLPAFIDDLTIRSLGLGEAQADIQLVRNGAGVSVNVLRRTADVSVALSY
ncbi:amylo-alpha-1,6-glucosidase [Rhodobacteraceae bacterium 2CG4]|uniref:Amylo-alpha-1,6-glucosidase n=1 Tax=Halovulum marinum TaxID=2662447 RepID=A0A6L5Z1A6_9RHOB|nr:amylo-alpha-1,6-glucosidase [Halovulum marinum]MSU90353.1 amylo-alpha-1,6-glucosidase [Halovulum marinum]